MKSKETIIHTEAIKKRYSRVEKEIKRKLTEVLLMNDFGSTENISRWLSITKDFKIRELSAEENSKFLSNPSTIKSSILWNTTRIVERQLFKLIDDEVDDRNIAKKYKGWISEFFKSIRIKNVNKLLKTTKNSTLFIQYLYQNREREDEEDNKKEKTNKEKNEIMKRNVRLQIAKILYEKFWDEAFSTKPNRKKGKEPFVILSNKSLNYICTIFNIANKVRESRWKRIDQVFHDGDFPFITNDIKASESDYIDVITYLLDRWKSIYYNKRWDLGQKQRSKKTSQYADILRALTDNQLRIHEYANLWEWIDNFERDNITKNLLNVWWWLLDNIVTTHNEYNPSKKLQLSKRLKSASSSVEKIIEWKKINDAIWLRLSMKWISDQNFDDIKKISRQWFQTFKASLNAYPEKYVPKWQTISIKKISIDNKWVLEQEQLNDILFDLNKIIPTEIRNRPPSPYIEENERVERMEKYYPEIIKDPKKWETVQTFYRRITWGRTRWKNWSYKDFKFNITFEIKDKTGNFVWERNMEVQFDDVNNGKWLSNYNIRNFERRLNTQSRLSFSVPLREARKNCEKNLKNMRLWARKWTEWTSKKEQKEFFDIKFNDWSTTSIRWFARRNDNNKEIMDETIVKVINYFLEKWTFILCYNPIQGDNIPNTVKKHLTVNDLHNPETMENLHICSSLELASQQHSYLQNDRDRMVWIYLDDQKDIWWISLWDLIDPMNLWKKKDKAFSAGL